MINNFFHPNSHNLCRFLVLDVDDERRLALLLMVLYPLHKYCRKQEKLMILNKCAHSTMVESNTPSFSLLSQCMQKNTIVG